jgi:hypothetical protein
MKKVPGLFIILLILASCYHSAPDPDFNMDLVIQADSMVSLLTDIHLAEGIISSLKSKHQPVGHLSSEYFEVVLKRHSISREAFEESLQYYAFHTEELDEIYEKVITELSKRESLYRQEVTAEKPSE